MQVRNYKNDLPHCGRIATEFKLIDLDVVCREFCLYIKLFLHPCKRGCCLERRGVEN